MIKIQTALIMPVLNCLDYTKQFLDTFMGKTKVKMVLINNASTDGTEKYFSAIHNDFNTRVFNLKENIGVSGAWNFGIEYATKHLDCRNFFIINNDTILHPEAIDILLETLENPKILLATATDISGKVPIAKDILKLKVPSKSNFTECPDFSCFMVNSSTIEKIGWFDEKFYPAYFEDNDYHYRIRMNGFKAVKTNQALYFHFGSRTIKDDEKVKEKCNIGYAANREYYIQKWGGEPGKEIFKTPFGK